MANDYVPRSDAGALEWMAAFRDNIRLDPPQFGLQNADADQIASVVDAFQEGYYRAVNEMTRTKGTIRAKDQLRATALHLCRGYAIEIKHNAGVSVEAKRNIGVRPPSTAKTPTSVPTTPPAIFIVGANQGTHEIRYVDPANGNSKARPRGARTLQLFIGIAEPNAIIKHPEECAFYGAFTRSPIGVQFKSADNAQRATYYARWAGKGGEFGPWSTPATMTICA